MVVVACDRSLTGDRVAHYAGRFAAQAPARRLRHVHVGRVAAEAAQGQAGRKSGPTGGATA